MKRSSRGPAIASTAAAALALLAGALQLDPASAAPSGAAAPGVAATGGPGAASYFDLARKDCLGTAANTTSKVWYTVADGVLSDVYEPTVDNTNVETLQYVVTDGSTFTDLQTRDMTYTVQADPTGMECTITSTDAKHGFELVTTYVTDPQRDTVLMNTRIEPTRGSTANVGALQVYARLDAHVNGDGGGGTENAGGNTGVIDARTGIPVVYSTNTTTEAANRTYAVPTYMAMTATSAGQASVGYEGTASDGLTQLDAAHALTPDHLGRRRAHRRHRERDPGRAARAATSPSRSASAAPSSRRWTPPPPRCGRPSPLHRAGLREHLARLRRRR